MRLHAEEHIRQSTNARVRATVKAGGTPGPAASIGKVHQGRLNQQLQLAACELSGMEAIAWEGDWLDDMPYATKGMIRSRANTIEGGTTEVNKNVLGEKVLGLPRESIPTAASPGRRPHDELSAPDHRAIRAGRLADQQSTRRP